MKLQLPSRSPFFIALIVLCLELTGLHLAAIDIAPMTWIPRDNWINVKTAASQIPGGINAVGDGVADDTLAIQSTLNYLMANPYSRVTKTVYFPPGTYKISTTLKVTNISGYNLVGSGLNTIIKWYGPAGGAMFWANGGTSCRYTGFVWDGGGTGGLHGTGGASCAYEEYSASGMYMTRIRHENESFRNFTVTGTYLTDNYYPNGFPPAAIISGFNSLAQPVGEVTIFNCRFYNCTTGIYNSVDIFNSFVWVIDGCEFDNNGTGFNGGGGACYVLMNSHFLQNTTDIQGGYSIRGQRLTSSGSGQFFSGSPSDIFQDCWIDGWTDTAGTMMFNRAGQASVVDCSFTNPPVGALGPIWLYEDVALGQNIMLSNNYAPNFPAGPGILHQQVATNIDWVPSGSMGGNLTSPTQTFLQSTYPPDGSHIIDVTKDMHPPADPNFTTDSTGAIQAAIDAAQIANDGTIVYIPVGIYKISSTITATGGNYSIEGEGADTQLCWYNTSGGTILAVTNPQSLSIKHLNVVALDNLSGRHGYNPSWPTCDETTITGIKQTATSGGSMVYDDIYYGAMIPLAGGSNEGDVNGPGIVLSGLPAGSTVYMPVIDSPLTVTDCGQAKIFAKMAYIGAVNVSGATNPKTGFLGLMVAEGGQQTAGGYNFTIDDNQDLLVGPYYSEQCANDFNLLGGSGISPGRVTVQVMNSAPTPTSTTINVDDYRGRCFYGGGGAPVSGGSTNPPVQITQTGSNPINLTLALDGFYGTQSPVFTLDSGANLIATLNRYIAPGQPAANMTDTPNPLTATDYTALAQSWDDFRQLGALSLAVEYGTANPSGLVAYWKLDEAAGPSADSTMSGMTGTWQNNPVFSTGTPAAIPYADPGCLTFNGTDQYIDMANAGALPSGTQVRTICGWAKAGSTASGYRWIAAYGSPSTSQAMFIGMNGTTLVGGAYADDLSVANFWDSNWHFIVLTYDGTTAKLYADGNLKASAAKTWNLVPGRCYIGEQVNDEDEYWNGSIDDVRIYNRALSAAEIASLETVLTPVAVTGYTQDVIYGPAAGDTGATAKFQGYYLYAAGQGADGGVGGLPASGTIHNPTNPNATFQLQPYNASNVLPIQSGSGTLTLTTPTHYTKLGILLTEAGVSGVSFTLNFSDGSHTVTTVSALPYWVSGDPGPTGGSVAFHDRALVGDGTIINLDEYDIALSAADSVKTLNSITVAGINYSYGTLGIFAVSGH